jgi:AGZA family xanthine/uracil permease-like MFS transporter
VALSRAGSTLGREVVAGLATFMTMAYIIFVNPAILSSAGMPPAAVTAATCIGAAVPTLLMGIWTNYPLALASGMGLNAAVAFQATRPGMTWQIMMGVVVIEGLIVTLLVLTGTRAQIMTSIPQSLKHSIAVGIGIFITFLGFQQMGWVIKGPGGLYLTHGSFQSKPVLVATLGLLLTAWLLVRKIPGTILLGILGTTVIAAIADRLGPSAPALTSLPKSVWSFPDFSVFAKADVLGAFKPSLAGLIFAFLITDFFDTMGTVIAIGKQAGFLDAQGDLPRLKRVLMVDSLAAVWGGVCGASSVTTYIESAAGVSEGGKTGYTSIVVSVMFLLALFFTPLFGIVPAVATAPALVMVGFLMIGSISEIDFKKADEAIPAFLILLLIPLTESISRGIGTGFIGYVLLQILTGKGSQTPLALYILAVLFVVSFVLQ